MTTESDNNEQSLASPHASADLLGPRESLEAIPVLESLTTEERAALASECTWQDFAPEDIITDPSDETGAVFFLTEGRARVVNHSLLGSEVRLSDIEVGAYFGELSAFDQGPRTASVIAVEACHVAAMPREVFFTMISRNPRVLRPILSDLASMVRQTNQKVMEYHLL